MNDAHKNKNSIVASINTLQSSPFVFLSLTKHLLSSSNKFLFLLFSHQRLNSQLKPPTIYIHIETIWERIVIEYYCVYVEIVLFKETIICLYVACCWLAHTQSHQSVLTPNRTHTRTHTPTHTNTQSNAFACARSEK